VVRLDFRNLPASGLLARLGGFGRPMSSTDRSAWSGASRIARRLVPDRQTESGQVDGRRDQRGDARRIADSQGQSRNIPESEEIGQRNDAVEEEGASNAADDKRPRIGRE
jgi:hypothetical protein